MSNQQFIKDFMNMAGGAMETAGAMRKEFEAMLKPYIDQALKKMHLVTRDEFEVVKKMAVEARKENEKLKKELEKLTKSPAKKATVKKPTVKKSTTKKS